MSLSTQPSSLHRYMVSPVAQWSRWQPEISGESLVLLASIYFTAFSNGQFWQHAISSPLMQWRLALSLCLLITALHAFLLGLVIQSRTARPVLAVLLVVTAVATHFMSAYGIYLDPDMLRNVMHTDRKESAELLGWHLLTPIALSAIPVALLWRVRLRQRPWRRALWIRVGFLLAMLGVMSLGVMLSFPQLSSLMRNQHQLRYLVTPSNYVVSLAKAVTSDRPGKSTPRRPIGLDARQMPASTTRRPRLLVLVVGETVRAANWGLNGYARDTTPELAQAGVINFPDVTACGSATEVSLPCMFSPQGRRAYDEHAIRHQQSLLHVLEHAGIHTLWRDNQSGCKGVCEGLPLQALDDSRDPALCNGIRCLDEILIKGLDEEIALPSGDRVVVLHPLGNHGPSYFERYPAQFRRFTPECTSPDLGECSREEIVNAYDNAVSYTDHFLASLIEDLARMQDHDTAMIYVSDHGESLGEKGLFLHGMPYAIAPDEQIKVPMVMWLSSGLAADAGIDRQCLQQRGMQPVSHDNLFSSVLGVMDVRTTLYEPGLDLFTGCRRATANR